MNHGIITMRHATAGDAAAIARLVELEEAEPLAGEPLVDVGVAQRPRGLRGLLTARRAEALA